VTILDNVTTYQDFNLIVSPLTIKSVSPTWVELGNDLDFTILGAGFDANTRVSMYPLTRATDVQSSVPLIRRDGLGMSRSSEIRPTWRIGVAAFR
jgi:hypothetical protein